jgi:hypothetical protein
MPKKNETGGTPVSPLDMLTWFHGLEVPDPITFITSPEYLNRSELYPRQGTLIKCVFLRDDLFTQYDLDVIEEWTETFKATGNNGIQPDILERIKWCQEDGRKWFREVVNVSGRRGGKGYVGALCMAYVLWCYMAYGDPQGHYGVDRSKKLAAMCFAGKLQQAKEQVWRDLVNVIIEAPCFQPFIADLQAEKLTVYAPKDFVKMRNMKNKGVDISKMNMATFEIVPLPSTLMSGRGPASFMQCLDPSTPVLTDDLMWVPLGEIEPGDVVIGVDEDPIDGQRKMRPSEVQAVWRTTKEAMRLTFADGSEVTCSPDHRWLRRDGWSLAENLKVGTQLRSVVDPWEWTPDWETGYLAGLYDGEGCVSGWRLRNGKSVFFTQNPGEVLDTVLTQLKDRGFNPKRTDAGRKAEQWTLTGIEAMAFLGSVRPSRLIRQSRGVWDGVAPRGGWKTITQIERLPEQELVDITTSTRTFIANGLVSHNCYDEMAHVVASGANRSAEEVYGAATPSLDQFGKDGFIYEPSSPWQMMGQFYENYNMALQRDPVAFDDDGAVIKDEAAYPTIMMVQLTSWDPYVDWERSHLIPMYPPGFLDGVDDEDIPRFTRKKNAIQEYDLQMQKLEKSNPETFAVERRSHFATALDAYLNPNMVDRMFTGEWKGRPIVMQPEGKLHLTYKAHGDPALVNDRFGFAVAHAEVDDETGLLHCVFDVVHYWEAQDWPDNVIDYIHVEKDLWGFVQAFKPDELTFDQWNSASSIQKLQMQVRQANFNKRVQVFCKPANSTYNFSRAETFKTALNMGWLHAPMSGTDRAVDVAINELKFLQFINGKVDHPDMGPVQSKDVADCLMECVQTLIGDQVNNFLAHSLGTQAPKGMMQGGDDPLKRFSSPTEGNPTLSGFLAGRTGDRTQRAQQGSSMGNYLKTGIRRGSRGSGNPFKGRTPWDNDA